MKKQNKLYSYIKENKWYLLVMIVASIAFIVQMKEVVLYADDFSLGIISKGGFSAIFSYFKNNYLNWGGGLTCLLATTFLMFRVGVWKIFQCILVISTVVLATRMITYNSKKNKALVATIIWLCLYMLNIWISRETLYWLDGGLAYKFTAFQIFVYFYYLYTRIHLKISKKYDKILLPVTAFFAGWSSAQTGPLVLVIPVLLMLWQRVIKKEKISKFYYITTIIGLIGFAIFYFAPGNSSRMEISFAEYASYNIVQRIFYRWGDVYSLIFDIQQYQFTGIPFYMLFTLGLTSIIGISLFKNEENKKIKLLAYVTAAIQLIFLFISLGIALDLPYSDIIAKLTIKFDNILYARRDGTLGIGTLIPYAVATIVIIANIVEAFLIALQKKDPNLPITIISALIMQGIMVMAPYSPLRTTYYTIMFLWFAIAYLIKNAHENKIQIGMIAIAVFAMYNFKLGFMALIAYALLNNNNTFSNINKNSIIGELAIVIMLMATVAGGNYLVTLKNYKLNKDIYNQNISRIEEFKKAKENGEEIEELYLLSPVNETYGFTPMTGIDWVEEAIKEYFELGDIVLKEEVVE